MTTTTVKISKEANRKLDALQARARIHSGKHLTKQAVLERIIDRALTEEEPVLLNPPKYPVAERVLRRLRDYPVDWGVETSESEIDRILYGGDG